MLTTKIGGSFGNTIHLHPVKQTSKHQDQLTKKQVDSIVIARRAYTRTHVDPEAQHFIKFYANTRLDPALEGTGMPEFLEPPDPVTYYAKLAELRKSAAGRVAKKYETVNLTL